MLDLPRNAAGLDLEALEVSSLVLLFAPHRLPMMVLVPGRMTTPELHADSLVPSPLLMLNIMFNTVMSIAVDKYMAIVTSSSCPNRSSNEWKTT